MNVASIQFSGDFLLKMVLKQLDIFMKDKDYDPSNTSYTNVIQVES